MELITIGWIGIIALVTLIMIGVPLAFAIGVVAILGNIAVANYAQTSLQLYQVTFHLTTEFVLTSVPLFIFMGQLVSSSGIGRDVYEVVHKWLGRLPGGLAVTSVVSCAGFGAVTGISAAAVATLGTIVMLEMKRYGYSDRLAAGSLASASTLAILIPPSLAMVVYGTWTSTSIGKLFIAGIIPGIFVTIVYSAYIIGACIANPKLGPRSEFFPLAERVRSLVKLLPVLGVFFFLIGGLYLGWFTPTEGAASGAFAVMVLLAVMKRLTWKAVADAARQTAQLSVMVFAILIAVGLFSRFLVLTDVTGQMVQFINAFGLNKYVVFMMIVVLYVILGMFLDGLGMMLLTLPFVFPIVQTLGFDPIWFGIIMTIMIEIGLLTPPVGLNCYILAQIAPHISLGEIFRGVVPFTIWPEFVLWLPQQMFGK
ncbi:MAG: TRAP transporter large permease [Betaproteobacteria bacterium]|nr:TRAP transporter large permease [Betaproteobacteria bacterium]